MKELKDRNCKMFIKNYYTPFFQFCVKTGLIHLNIFAEKKEKSKRTKEVVFYYSRPLMYLLGGLYNLPKLLIPGLGIFRYLDSIFNLPDIKNPVKDTFIMGKGRRKKLERRLKALRESYGFGIIDLSELDEEDYYLPAPTTKKKKKAWGTIDDYYSRYPTGDYGSRSIPVTSSSPTIEKSTTVKTWSGKVEEGTVEPEDEITVFDVLRKSLELGYIKSVERYFKHHCNIYPTGFGYALERIARTKNKIYLDINLDYVKIWEGDDKKVLLFTLIRELEQGIIQETQRQSLEDILILYSGDKICELPENKQGELKNYYSVSCIPEDLKLKKIK